MALEASMKTTKTKLFNGQMAFSSTAITRRPRTRLERVKRNSANEFTQTTEFKPTLPPVRQRLHGQSIYLLNEQLCNHCGRKGRLNINPFTCSTDGCNEKCHQSCSGISRYSRNRRWYFKNHNTSTCYLPPRKQVTTSELSTCDACGEHLTSGAHRIHCTAKGCLNLCHRAARCSNITSHSAKWKCLEHSENSGSEATSKSRSQLKQQLKINCGSCHKTIRVNTTPVVCGLCALNFHKKCTKLTKLLADCAADGKYTWNCKNCEDKKASNDFMRVIGGMKIETSVQDLNQKSKSSLRILQWNADGVNSKHHELQLRLKEGNYDICLIQESKLRPHQATPHIDGYSTIRLDRVSKNGGGGILSYIRDTLVFERVQEASKNGTESSIFRVKMGKRKWASICNIYCPPVRSHSSAQSVRLNLDAIPHSKESIILGDFNAHCHLWDPFQPQDNRGEKLLNWTLDHDMTIMNDGSHTRINTKARYDDPNNMSQTFTSPTQGKSSPDVSICGSTWSSKFSWTTVESIGSSDHSPICVSINAEVKHGSVFKGRTAWRTSGVDWSAFSEAVEQAATTKMPSTSNIRDMASEFHAALIAAAKRFVGTVKSGRRSKTWETPAVREAIRKRNRLRKQIRTHRIEWLKACRDAQDKINEAKTNAWRKVLEDSTQLHDDGKMWKVIKSLNGTPDTNSPNEAMHYKGQLITSNKRKADIFVGHYASVSNLSMLKEDRTVNRLLKKRLGNIRKEVRTLNPSDKQRNYQKLRQEPDFTITELKNAIDKMKKRGAPGADNIPPLFLKNLGPKALEKLLSIFNMAFQSADVPQAWKDAIIIPLLKNGKHASEITSFRPISLTSCVVKLMERMISERLYYIAERKGWFSKLQAGFRKGRGVEDQILRVTQKIADGFEKKEKSLLTLLDFSKAYDTVWRERLLHSLLDQGVPSQYVLFLRGFLLNRQARVRFNGVLSKSKLMKQGLPQGSVLAPILFLFYINNLSSLFSEDLTISMYADDVSILSSSTDLRIAERQTQTAVDTVVSWSKLWKLNLNGTKSEVSVFTLSKLDKDWFPSIEIDGNNIKYEPHARLLGVTLDRRLTFKKQVEAVTAKATQKMGMLRAVANSEWGWRKEDLRKIFLAHIQSVLNFASSSWQPWLRKSLIKKLQVVQNQCLRIITTQAKSSPVEALHAETRVPTIKTTIDANCLRSYEKALRMQDDHPRKIAATDKVHRRLKSRRDFRKKAEELLSCNPHINCGERQPLQYFQVKPWERGIKENTVFPSLCGIKGKKDNKVSIQTSALKRSRELGAHFNIYTDGSAISGTRDGGAGVVVTTGDPSSPTVIESLYEKGAQYTCSYEEEKRAMELAIDWVDTQCDPTHRVSIFTDSQSLCMALLNNNENLDKMRRKIDTMQPRPIIQWIPGHCNIPGNDLADSCAKLAGSLPGKHLQSISYGSVCTQIKACIKDPEIVHTRTREVYQSLSLERESQVMTRSDQSLLAKLRSGHFTGLRAYQNRIDGSTDPTCPLCKEEPQDLQHWLTGCPETAAQ